MCIKIITYEIKKCEKQKLDLLIIVERYVMSMLQ